MSKSALEADAAGAAFVGAVFALGAVGAMQALVCVGHAGADGLALGDRDACDQG